MSEGFGLLYESTFTGSMFGTSTTIFAVWGYVVAHGYGGTVDLTPKVLAATFNTTIADVEAAIQFHCAPDPQSRSDVDEGRRLRHLGGVTYEIVNHELYRNARALEEKRAYNRQKQRASRERRSAKVPIPIFDLSKKSVTTVDPLDLDSVSVSRSGSDPEGVQGEGGCEGSTEQESRPLGVPADAAPPTLHTRLGDDWVIPPELYDEAEREHGIGREELEHRVAIIRNRKIPGDGVWDRTEYVRGLLAEWATWEPPKPKGVRKSRHPPAERRRPPLWVDDGHLAFAREYMLTPSAMAREFATRHQPHRLPVDDARAAFSRFLEAKASAAFAPTAEHRSFATQKGLDVRLATNAYRASGRPGTLGSTLRANEDFMRRLEHWAETGEFVPDGALSRERARGAA